MADHDSVRQALRHLASRPTDEPGSHPPDRLTAEDGSYRAVIEEATTAVSSLSEAAQFRESAGLDALAGAIDEAAAAGDQQAAKRGRRALSEFRAFRRACDGSRGSDHFRSGRGTPLGSDTQDGDE